MIRRALSSESGFFAFMDLGLGLLGSLPSLRDQGSGVTEERMRIFKGLDEGWRGDDRNGTVVRKKEDWRESISQLLLTLVLCFLRGKPFVTSKEFRGYSEEVPLFS